MMKPEELVFDDVKIRIKVTRWNVDITIIKKNGEEEKYFISADSFYTERDGIYFASEKEKEEYDLKYQV